MWEIGSVRKSSRGADQQQQNTSIIEGVGGGARELLEKNAKAVAPAEQKGTHSHARRSPKVQTADGTETEH